MKKIVSVFLVLILFLTATMAVCAENAYSINLEIWKQGGKACVYVKNVATAEIGNINIFLALFDKSGKLTECSVNKIKRLTKYGNEIASFNLSDKKFDDSYNIKAFAWSENTPFSDAVYLKMNGADADKTALILWFRANNSKMYSYGNEYTLDNVPIIVNGILMSDLRSPAEALCCNVNWDDSTNTAVITKNKNTLILQANNTIAFFNGESFTLSAAPCIRNGTVYIPTADIVSKLGYKAEFNAETEELFVSDDESEKRIEEIGTYSVLPEYLFEKDRTEYLTRLDAARLLASIYETITTEELAASDVIQTADTEDLSVKKLVVAGIAKTDANKMFYPENLITNADFAEMLYKTLELADVFLMYDEDDVRPFYDDADIPPKLKKIIYSLKSYGAFEAAYINIFDANEFLTDGQALVTAGNCLSLSYYSVFWDVAPDSPYRKAIVNLFRKEIMNGYEDGSFKPDEYLTRAEFCVLAARIMNTDDVDSYEFACADVSAEHWGRKYIGYCVANGIFELRDGKFRPDEQILNIEAISALLKVIGYQNAYSETEAFEKACDIGITDGIDDPKLYNKAVRENIAQLLFNTLNIM